MQRYTRRAGLPVFMLIATILAPSRICRAETLPFDSKVMMDESVGQVLCEDPVEISPGIGLKLSAVFGSGVMEYAISVIKGSKVAHCYRILESTNKAMFHVRAVNGGSECIIVAEIQDGHLCLDSKYIAMTDSETDEKLALSGNVQTSCLAGDFVSRFVWSFASETENVFLRQIPTGFSAVNDGPDEMLHISQVLDRDSMFSYDISCIPKSIADYYYSSVCSRVCMSGYYINRVRHGGDIARTTALFSEGFLSLYNVHYLSGKQVVVFGYSKDVYVNGVLLSGLMKSDAGRALACSAQEKTAVVALTADGQVEWGWLICAGSTRDYPVVRSVADRRSISIVRSAPTSAEVASIGGSKSFNMPYCGLVILSCDERGDITFLSGKGERPVGVVHVVPVNDKKWLIELQAHQYGWSADDIIIAESSKASVLLKKSD